MLKLFSEKGFSLLEVMIVTAIIGVLATLAIPSFVNIRTATQTRICIANQRTLYNAAALYEIMESPSLSSVGGQKARLDRLTDTGYIKSSEGFECPLSPYADYDDYRFVFEDGELSDIECTISPSDHKWPSE